MVRLKLQIVHNVLHIKVCVLLKSNCTAQNRCDMDGKKPNKRRKCLLDVVFIRLTVHSTDAHVLHHLNTTESCNTSSYK